MIPLPDYFSRPMKAKHNGVDKATRFIARHYNNLITVEDLVAVSGMSRRGFHKAFVRLTGGTPHQQLQNVRINHAKTLLVTGNFRINQIAAYCGYRSLNTFYVAFKRAT